MGVVIDFVITAKELGTEISFTATEGWRKKKLKIVEHEKESTE